VLESFAGGLLFGVRSGRGSPWVLLLHGWGRDHEDFAAVLCGTNGKLQGPGALDAIALDLPGFGSTPAPEVPMGTEGYAAEVAKVLEVMGDEVVVVGHSFGGRVALRIAARHPERVKALVLAGAPLVPVASHSRRKPSTRYKVMRSLAKAGIVSEERLERARRRFGSSDYAAAKGVMRSVLVQTLAEDYADEIRAVSCPVELVWGEMDSEVPLSVAQELLARWPQAKLTVCKGAGHLLPRTNPSALREAIERQRPSGVFRASAETLGQ